MLNETHIRTIVEGRVVGVAGKDYDLRLMGVRQSAGGGALLGVAIVGHPDGRALKLTINEDIFVR